MIVGHCGHCERDYCLKHRLPEAHQCTGMRTLCSSAREALRERLHAQALTKRSP